MELYRAKVYYKNHPIMGKQVVVRYATHNKLKQLKRKLQDEYRDHESESEVVITRLDRNEEIAKHVYGDLFTFLDEKEEREIEESTYRLRRQKRGLA